MPAYLTSPKNPVPWLVWPDEKERAQHSLNNEDAWNAYNQQTLRDCLKGVSGETLLAIQQTHQSLQFQGADEFAKELGMTLDMRALHKDANIGLGRVLMSSMCLLPYTEHTEGDVSLVHASRIEGFNYRYGFIGLAVEPKNRTDIASAVAPCVGIDRTVLEWLFQYGSGENDKHTGLNEAQMLLRNFRTIAMLGDHDWFHSATLPLSSRQKPLDMMSQLKAFNAARGNVDPEFTSMRANWEVFSKLFRDNPGIKRGVLRQGVLFLDHLENIRERALEDAATLPGPERDARVEFANRSCNYMCEIMMAHLLRLPISREDLEAPHRTQLEEGGPLVRYPSIRHAYEALGITPKTTVEQILQRVEDKLPGIKLSECNAGAFNRWYYGVLWCHGDARLAALHHASMREAAISWPVRLQHQIKNTPLTTHPEVETARRTYEESEAGKKAEETAAHVTAKTPERLERYRRSRERAADPGERDR